MWLLMIFPNISIAFTFVIKNVIPIKHHFKFDDFIPDSTAECPANLRAVLLFQAMTVARFSW